MKAPEQEMYWLSEPYFAGVAAAHGRLHCAVMFENRRELCVQMLHESDIKINYRFPNK